MDESHEARAQTFTALEPFENKPRVSISQALLTRADIRLPLT